VWQSAVLLGIFQAQVCSLETQQIPQPYCARFARVAGKHHPAGASASAGSTRRRLRQHRRWVVRACAQAAFDSSWNNQGSSQIQVRKKGLTEKAQK